MTSWNNDTEIQFFKEALKSFASPEQLFYDLHNGYFAYVPKGSVQKEFPKTYLLIEPYRT